MESYSILQISGWNGTKDYGKDRECIGWIRCIRYSARVSQTDEEWALRCRTISVETKTNILNECGWLIETIVRWIWKFYGKALSWHVARNVHNQNYYALRLRQSVVSRVDWLPVVRLKWRNSAAQLHKQRISTTNWQPIISVNPYNRWVDAHRQLIFQSKIKILLELATIPVSRPNTNQINNIPYSRHIF